MENDIIYTIKDRHLEKEHEDDIELKLAHLIINYIIFCNNGWWDKSWPQDKVTLHVNCNDVFAWGAADAEDINHGEIRVLYEMFKKDPIWGSTIWCIQKRGRMPQKPVADRIKEAGLWDLDSMNLQENK